MKILFLGYAISIEEASGTYGASIAGNKMQINLLKNLSVYPELEILSITVYPIAAYPKTKSLFIKSKSINLFNGFSSLRIAYLNLPVIKQLYITIATYFAARKIIKKEGITILFTYNMFPEIGLPARWLRKKYGCTVISLLADLPIDDTVSRKGYSVILRKYFDKLTRKNILHCDKIIALNKHAVEVYAPGVPYIIVEGGIDNDDITQITSRIDKKKNIVYSGALVEYSGILNLIEAMKFIDDKTVTLDIYGSGQIEEYVKLRAEQTDNIKFHGKVDNVTMKKIQQNAFLLVNPRPIDNPIAMVTFPSKIFDYMLSGTPVLSTRLNGFPEEYFDKIYFVNSNEPDILAQKINEILKVPINQLHYQAIKAREFVIENKTWVKQCARIYSFLNNTTNGSGK